ncbi:MAG TPA: DUF308 domain-containing protein [Acidimicrobiales bacterium]|nr:DUF308 domain-containing protein [Acidimicrobiales bacterium]
MFVQEQAKAAAREVGATWWWFLVAAAAWFVIAAIVLRLDLSSTLTVGLLIGVIFLVAALAEFLIAAVRESWGWAHVLLGALFVGGAIWCFIRPYHAFWSLAAAFGLLLILYGILDIVESIASEPVNNVWWLGLIAGFLMIGLGFWASEQFLPARAELLLLFVGFFALFRGFSDIALAFEIKSLGGVMEKSIDSPKAA